MHQINLLPCDIYFISHLYELRSEQRYSIELGESNPLQLWEQKFHDTDLNEEKRPFMASGSFRPLALVRYENENDFSRQ